MESTLFRQCARMVMVGFPGKTVDDGLRRMLAHGVFGAILFKRNVGSFEETRELCQSLRTAAPGLLALAVDQEGGRVARLRGDPYTTLLPMRAIGEVGDIGLAER